MKTTSWEVVVILAAIIFLIAACCFFRPAPPLKDVKRTTENVTPVPEVAPSPLPVPPQGLYDYGNIASPESLSHLDKMGAAGFTLVLMYTSGSSNNTEAEYAAYLARAERNGIEVIWDFNELVGEGDAPATAAEVVGKVKDHPATWGYYVGDENSQDQAAEVEAMADAIFAADPDHPRLYVGNYSVAELPSFNGSAEVLGLDIYPIGQGIDSKEMTDRVGTVAGELKQFNAENGKRTAMVLQAFNWGEDPKAPLWHLYNRWPTRMEMRAMRDQAIVHGDPEMILWFSYYYAAGGATNGSHWEDLVWAAFGA